MHVLVHIDLDQGLGPIGAWGYSKYGLRHFYPESLDVEISARARNLMAQRDNDTPVTEWMDLIADADPTPLDSWRVIEADDNDPLPIVLSDFRRTWMASTTD
jgi:hypothetical protein